MKEDGRKKLRAHWPPRTRNVVTVDLSSKLYADVYLSAETEGWSLQDEIRARLRGDSHLDHCGFDTSKDATFARLEALISAINATPCTNQEAAVALMMLFGRLDERDPRFLQIVLGASGYEKRDTAAGREPDRASAGVGRPAGGQPPEGGEQPVRPK